MKFFITKRGGRELDKIPDGIARNIVKHIFSLTSNTHPPNSKKLQGQKNYRLRIGSFRVIYTVDKKRGEITILRVADRKTIYK